VTVRFLKMQGTGNDFLLVEAQDQERDWGALARAMCERHYGVGADGLMLVLPSQRADVRMRLFNTDGSEAEVSGNGVRCLVKYAVERGLARPQEGRVRIEIASGVLEAEVFGDEGRLERVRLSMGAPGFAADEVPVVTDMGPPIVDMPLEVEGRTLAVTCVSMGNPHAVSFVDGPVEAYPLAEVGPKVERHPSFPERVNFGVARVLSRDRMEARVWERGVGETLACGTGSSAAMVAAHLKGLAGQRVDIIQPGGSLAVEWDGRGEVHLTGPAEFVFEGEWPEA
jgi:diaminopimelate epimerase